MFTAMRRASSRVMTYAPARPSKIDIRRAPIPHYAAIFFADSRSAMPVNNVMIWTQGFGGLKRRFDFAREKAWSYC
jgi:hypothetical protein